MARITPRTCLWPLVICLCITFALSIGLTYRSNHHCYAGTCGEWLFPLQARLHVVVWYMWISLSVVFLGLRAFQRRVRNLTSKPIGNLGPSILQQASVGGLLLVLWICCLYGIIFGIWWIRLSGYFQERGAGLPGNNVVAAVAMTGHLADVTMGMVLLPVSRHSALTSYFELSPNTARVFHMVQAYLLLTLVTVHGCLYAGWAAFYNQDQDRFRRILPVLNPTYLYNEVWPGNTSSLGKWRASLIFTGICSTLIMFAMFFTSFAAVRRKHFNLFYFTHLLSLAAVVIICLHASTMLYCTLPGLSMYLLDWAMRIVELRDRIDSRLTALGKGWYSLSLTLPRKRVAGCACRSPLAHFYIHHSGSSFREIHPFTTITHLGSKKSHSTEGAPSIEVQFLFRESTSTKHPRDTAAVKKGTGKQWTNRLASLVDEESANVVCRDKKLLEGESTNESLSIPSVPVSSLEVDTCIRLEGPYFTPASPQVYKTVLCLVAGTGLSGAIAIAAAFKAQRSGSTCDAVSPYTEGSSCAVKDTEKAGRWTRCIVVWTVRETEAIDMPFFKSLACDGLEFRVHITGNGRQRPDMNVIVGDLCGGAASDTWCYISGPNGFMGSVEQVCAQYKGLKWFKAKWD